MSNEYSASLGMIARQLRDLLLLDQHREHPIRCPDTDCPKREAMTHLHIYEEDCDAEGELSAMDAASHLIVLHRALASLAMETFTHCERKKARLVWMATSSAVRRAQRQLHAAPPAGGPGAGPGAGGRAGGKAYRGPGAALPPVPSRAGGPLQGRGAATTLPAPHSGQPSGPLEAVEGAPGDLLYAPPAGGRAGGPLLPAAPMWPAMTRKRKLFSRRRQMALPLTSKKDQ